MLLCVDVGNTNITFGLYEKDKLINQFRLQSDRNLDACQYKTLLRNLFSDFSISHICDVAYCSVVDELNDVLHKALFSVIGVKPFVISNNVKSGVTIIADNPSEVGADRIANAAYAAYNYDGAVIVIDFGTATTFDVVNSKKEFCGGIILPGVKTQLKSLNLLTSKLPDYNPDKSDKVLGNNTKDAIMSGVIRGSASAVDGLIKQCEITLGEPAKIIATGGYCLLVQNYINRKFDEINQDLTLSGIKIIYELNK